MCGVLIAVWRMLLGVHGSATAQCTGRMNSAGGSPMDERFSSSRLKGERRRRVRSLRPVGKHTMLRHHHALRNGQMAP